MGKATYEFPYVSSRNKVHLMLCKALVISLMLMFLATLVKLDKEDFGENLMFVSGVLNMCFVYINLMTVRVEVQELFEPPVQWKAWEFFWLGSSCFVVSFFV